MSRFHPLVFIRRKRTNHRLYRSQAWNRGHKDGYELALSHYPREQAWIKTLEKYYYSHINNCQKKNCKVCAKI